MNLVEHHIKEVHSVKDISDEFEQNVGYLPYEPLLEVDLTYDCYGRIVRTSQDFYKSDWEKSVERGYFMA